MSSHSRPEEQALLVRFIDAFLNENNIKWILGAGILIVLGSSSMLAASHWEDYTPLWKYSIMFAYTVAIYGIGRLSYRQLGLRTTGNALMALTVLLLPVLFVALHLVQGAGFWLSVPSAFFLVATLVFAYKAAGQIFEHFLRKPTPFFLSSYVLLSAAGALASLTPASMASLVAALLWIVYCLGVIKVNRHVFWLGEEHRLPRVFGFFPIALLSIQFLSVFFLFLSSQVDLSWIGFGCILVALPVFMTADTIWSVHKQRTGALDEPRAAVILPIIIGLALTAAAMLLAGFGFFSDESPYALVPTALVSAILMGFVARRTGKQSFVWLMIVTALVAYNFSPVFFRELARLLVQGGADAVGEECLPYAFYGLTYLPLFAALLALGHQFIRNGNRLFGRPIRITAIALAGIWLLMATTHAKAMTPVGMAMTLVFIAAAYLYRLPWLLFPAGGAWLLAGLGGFHFVNTVLLGHADSFGQSCTHIGPSMFIMAAATALLATPGQYIEVLLEKRADRHISTLRNMSAVATAVLAAWWSGAYVDALLSPQNLNIPAQVMSAALLLGMLVHHGLRLNHSFLKQTSVVFAYAVGILLWLPTEPSFSAFTSVLTLALCGQWILGYLLERHGVPRSVRAYLEPIRSSAYWGLIGALLVMSVLPVLFFGDFVPWWLARILAGAVAFDAAKKYGNTFLGYAACLSIFLIVAAATLTILGQTLGLEWLPATLSGTVLALLPVSRWLESLQKNWNVSPTLDAISTPLRHTLLAFLGIGGVGTLLFFSWPVRIAGALSVIGLFYLADNEKRRSYVLALANWHILATVVNVLAPKLANAFVAGLDPLASTTLAVVAGLSALLWRYVTPRMDRSEEPALLGVHRLSLKIATAAGLLVAAPSDLGVASLVLSAIGFALLIADELWAACRQNSSSRVWYAEVIGAAGVGFFALQGVIHFGRGISMFAVLGTGAALWLAGRVAQARETTSIMSDPLRLTALSMPALSVFIALGREALGLNTFWLGANSLALFLAAATYFTHGLTHGAKWSLISSQLIVNLALIMLWDELSWSDPQLFMIPIGVSILFLIHALSDEIPTRLHRPLHYLGAMIILVSPTFNMVTGNWLHFFSLMLISVLVMIAAIGLRLRALLYMGASFLAADMVAMVVRGSIDRPNTLWLAGLVLGGAVVALGAFSENNRDKLTQKIRALGAVLDTWG